MKTKKELEQALQLFKQKWVQLKKNYQNNLSSVEELKAFDNEISEVCEDMDIEDELYDSFGQIQMDVEECMANLLEEEELECEESVNEDGDAYEVMDFIVAHAAKKLSLQENNELPQEVILDMVSVALQEFADEKSENDVINRLTAQYSLFVDFEDNELQELVQDIHKNCSMHILALKVAIDSLGAGMTPTDVIIKISPMLV